MKLKRLSVLSLILAAVLLVASFYARDALPGTQGETLSNVFLIGTVGLMLASVFALVFWMRSRKDGDEHSFELP